MASLYITYFKLLTRFDILLNDSEVKGRKVFNIDKDSFDEYRKNGYDSIAWFRKGKLVEFIALDPSIVKEREISFQKYKGAMLAEDTRDEVESVVEEMNQMSDEVANFEVPSNLSTKEKSKLSSLVSRFSNKIKKLWKGGIIKDISEYNGIPFLFTISDQLSSGAIVNPFTGNTIDLKGGLGFTFTEGNEKNGWANVKKKNANDTVKNALEVI